MPDETNTPQKWSRRGILSAVRTTAGALGISSLVPSTPADAQTTESARRATAADAAQTHATKPAASVHPRFNYPVLGPPWPKPKRPSWLDNGVVFVGNWEPLQWAYRKNWQDWGNTRSGAGAEKLHKEDRSEPTVIGLKQMGVNMVFTSFHKGFGIENEKYNMDEARDYARLLHKHQLRMAVYVSTLLIYEDLYGEFPESKDWHRVLFDGTPDTYWNDGYRYRAFLNHPEYLNYMKRVCELAVKAGADAIFFDTVRQPAENFHPLATDMFRDWLKKKYAQQNAWYFRTGLRYRDYVKIQHYDNAPGVETFDNPMIQENIDFKCQLLADFAAEMGTFIRSQNPETAIWFNTGGVTGGNVMELTNLDHARLLPWLDIYYTEERDYAEYNEHGGIVSKIRTIKAGARFGTVHTNATGQPPPLGERSFEPPRDDPRLRLAEAMAFNRLALGNMGYGASYVIRDFPEEGRRYIRFYWKNAGLLKASASAADVAVLRTFASLSYSNYAPHRDTILAEQSLIQSQIAFDIIFDNDLNDLARYKVIVLGNQDCLSEAQVHALTEYVRNGGGLVGTFDTSIYDDWRRQRDGFGLSDVFGIARPPKTGDKQVHQNEFGKGRGCYLHHLTPAVPVPAKTAITVKYWVPPKNHAEFIQSVRWAARESLRWTIEAPDCVAADACYQPSAKRHVLHLVNYDCWKRPSLPGIKFEINGVNVTKAEAYSPDDDHVVTLPLTHASGRTSFTLPTLGIYSLITLEA